MIISAPEKNGPRDFYQLLYTDAQQSCRLFDIQIDAQLCQSKYGLFPHCAPPDDTQMSNQSRAQEDILCDAEVANDAEFLMDHADAAVASLGWRTETNRLSVETISPS